MNRQRWVLLVVFVAMVLAAWASAQETDDSYGKRFYSQEIWRLPPVRDFPALTPPTGSPGISYHTPAALQVPHYEMLPVPKPEPEQTGPGAHGENLPRPPSDLPIDDECVEPNPRPKKEKIWSGSFNLGLDGSQGAKETFNFHFGFNAKRKTKCSVFTFVVDFNRQTTDNVASENRLFADGRAEKLLGESRWSVFIHETVEYDELQPFDTRDATDIGVGYRVVDNDDTTLIGRVGGGFMHEFGGPNDGNFVPEIVFGTQFDHQISKRQKFIGSVEYAPDATNFRHYRIRAQGAWEVLLDEERNLNLRIGAIERYNNQPDEGGKNNELDYALMLMWKF